MKIAVTIVGFLFLMSGFTMAQPGNALNFDGNNDVVVVPNNSALEFETGTIEVWLKPDWVSGTLGYNPCFIGMRDGSGSRYSFHIRRDYSAIDIYNGFVGSVNYTFSQGEWYHIALVMNNTSTKVYINGIYKGTIKRTADKTKTGKNLNIGSGNGTSEFFNGEIDEVRIWSSQRTACEILSYRNTELVGDETNLLAYYNFNQGTAGGDNTSETSLTDLTSNSFNGTLTNFALTGTTSNWIASGADISNTGGVAVDNIPPTLTVPANITIECGSGSAIDPSITGTATATDICDANPAITYTDTDNGSSVTRTWTATDASANETTGEQIITVDITPPETPVLPALTGTDSVVVTPPTTTDACVGTITGTTSDPLKYTTQGSYTITWTFDDGHGNTTTADQTITVNNGLDMILNFNTNLSSGTTITLPLNGTVNVTVDWGDGSSESTTTAADLDHTYSSEGTYNVLISGTLTHFGNNGYANADKLAKVISFGSIGITDLSYAFRNASNLTEAPATIPSGVTNMASTFRSASNFNGNISAWDVSNVSDMSKMFNNATSFSADISNWNVGMVEDMSYMFGNTPLFDADISNWDVSNVLLMYNMFNGASAFKQNIGGWNVSKVTNMSGMFTGAVAFNQDLNSWNVSNVTDMSFMFEGATSFDQNISSWNVSNVTTMSGMFSGVSLSTANYDALLNAWSNLTLHNGITFDGGNSQYSCLGESAKTAIHNNFSWNFTDGGKTSNVTISTQPTGNTEVCENTPDVELSVEATGSGILSYQWYKDAVAITSNGTDSVLAITTDLSNSGTYTCVITGICGTDTTTNAVVTINDDVTPPDTPTLLTLVGEDSVVVMAPTTTDGCAGTITGTTSDPLKYTAQGTYTITWTFDDGNGNSITADQKVVVNKGQYMLLQYNTNLNDGKTVTLPLNGTVDVTVDWGDGSSESTTTAANLNHTYSSYGTYNVLISGTLTHFGSSHYPNVYTLTKVISFGNLGITDLSYAFYTAKNLTEVPSTLPTGVTNTSYMFAYVYNFNQDLDNWDVSSVTDMNSMFYNASAFNGNISSWDVSNVVDMSALFQYAIVFNGNISSWDVSNVQNMYCMFNAASAFNQDIGTWNTSSVTDMSWMFVGAGNFNQDLNDWDVSSVTQMEGMFDSDSVFNGNISSWNVSNVTNMAEMFYGAPKFNGDISGWDVSNVTDMSYMFEGADSFNQDISKWNVSNVTDMSYMFDHATSFDQDISNWDVDSVTNMTNMFSGVALSPANYDALLNKWSTLALQNNVTFDGGNSQYSCLSETARTAIINNFNWAINDEGLAADLITIVTQPVSSTSVYKNTSDIVLSVEATGTTALSYQWYKDEAVILTDETNPTLTIATDPVNSGSYDCNITTACGASKLSSVAYVDIMDDTTPPEMPILADLTGECSVTVTAPTTTDAAAGTITGTTSDPLEYTQQGTYTITWTFDDGNGNSINVDQNVVVKDVTNPTLSCVDNQVVNADATSYYTVQGTEFDPISTNDNCGITDIINDFNNLSSLSEAKFPVGTTTVTWTITDNAGNTSSCSFDVTVSATTGIGTIANKGISVYPNPVREKVNFNFSGNNVIGLTLSDITGKIIFEKNVAQQDESLDMSSWKKGVYIVRFQTDKEVISTKIIKE